MSQSKLDVTLLRKPDPVAWNMLLRDLLVTDELVVTGAVAQPLSPPSGTASNRDLSRYILKLANHTEPVTYIGKRTNRTEARFYQNLARHVPDLAARCLYVSVSDSEGWVILDDVPNHFPPETWTPVHVEDVIQGLSSMHAAFWNQSGRLQRAGLRRYFRKGQTELPQMKARFKEYFEEGPAAIISEHAVVSAGRLAPDLLRAANGLRVIRDLGGWPGVLGESHLAAAADLLDDPVPMLEPLRQLPLTLLHGNPGSYHWQLTIFDQLRLLDWHNARVGPGVIDLVAFLEQFDLLYDDTPWGMNMRQDRVVSEETMVDSYLIAMSSRLGAEFNARDVRQAIPAARCLHVMTRWFPYFAEWFSIMPNKYVWQRVNRMSDQRLLGTSYQPMIAFRPYLAAVFKRFLQAYRTL